MRETAKLSANGIRGLHRNPAFQTANQPQDEVRRDGGRLIGPQVGER